MQTQHRTITSLLIILLVALLYINTASATSFTASSGDLEPPLEDALIPPPPPANLASSQSASAGPSQFMAGNVAVRLVLPESNGSAEPSTEDWTEAQIDAVEQQVEAGLNWWVDRLPLAQLSFTVETQVLPTAYEPVNHGWRDENLWIADTLGSLGYSGSYFTRAYNATFDLRDQKNSDWATTIFIVNSANDSDGRFTDNRFAYAYINGPFMVLTSDVGAYGMNNLGPVISHELGHTFGALDQYSAARVSCNRQSGYLYTPTSNSEYGDCPMNLPSIMREVLNSFRNGSVDPSALAQIGYRDRDNDGIIDPLDTTPELTIKSSAQVQSSGQRPEIRGSSSDAGYPSPAQKVVSLNAITRIEYRVNNGSWHPTIPTDGAFDDTDEEFSIIPPLYDGTHVIELRAVNSVGATSDLSRITVNVSGVGEQPHYDISAPDAVKSQQVDIECTAPADTQAVQIGYDPLFTDATSWMSLATSTSFSLPSNEDGAYTFYVRFRDANDFETMAYSRSVLLDTQAPTGQALLQGDEPKQVILSASDQGSGVDGLELEIDGQASTWQDYTSRIDLNGEVDDVRVRFRDVAGNVSPYVSAQSQSTVYLPMVIHSSH